MPNDLGGLSLPPTKPPPAKPAAPTVIFPSIVLPMFLAVVDQTIIATALPAIATSLGNAERVSWVVISYLVAATVSAPLYGNLGDAFGRRRLLTIALVIFFAGALAGSLAQTLEQLEVGRALQGLGSGGLVTLSHALLGDAVPPRERTRYQGNIVTVVLISSALGPLIGGVMTEFLGWRSIFFASLPLSLLAMLLIRLLPAGRPASGRWRPDIGGVLLFAAFIVLLLVALEHVKGFRLGFDWAAVGILVPALLSLAALVWWEQRSAQPLFPLPLIRKPAIWRSYTLIIAHGGALLALVTFLPMYARMHFGLSPSASGLMLVPPVAGISLGTLVSGRLMARTGRTAIFAAAGMGWSATVVLAIALALPQLSPLALSLCGALALGGMGTGMGVAMVTLQVAGGPGALGITAGIAQLAKAIGAALATALASTILFLVLAGGEPPALGYFGPLLAEGTAALDGLAEAARQAVAGTVVAGFRAVFVMIALFLAAGALSAALLPVRRV